MKLTIHVKPLSINDAYRGAHYPTKEKTQYETALRYALPNVRVAPGPYYRIAFDFHLVNFALTDYDNLIKITQDCLVKRGIMTDDRLIVDARIRKFKADKDRIEIDLQPAADALEPNLI
ncbi:MAG: RusA family crossover junction endodeoxyribonuclease [Sphingomonadales bacterium]|nr:RusA family crossover junction endodeoxyribonuclease [Sphingomonadaceae bacterium]MBS3930387.1 RusA family crossover junction endodeoxyribonuclease [Sphingomonadales bacterium]